MQLNSFYLRFSELLLTNRTFVKNLTLIQLGLFYYTLRLSALTVSLTDPPVPSTCTATVVLWWSSYKVRSV